jgi:hypothetical protein
MMMVMEENKKKQTIDSFIHLGWFALDCVRAVPNRNDRTLGVGM